MLLQTLKNIGEKENYSSNYSGNQQQQS